MATFNAALAYPRLRHSTLVEILPMPPTRTVQAPTWITLSIMWTLLTSSSSSQTITAQSGSAQCIPVW